MVGQRSNEYNLDYMAEERGDFVIDEIRVWDTVRTSFQIDENKYKSLPMNTPGLNLMFTFDDKDGDDSIVQDASGKEDNPYGIS